MKKIISAALAGAVMLGLSACAGGTGSVGTDNVTEAVQSESVQSETVATEAETTAASNETVFESVDETVTAQSDDVAVAESEAVVAESESSKAVESETSETASTENKTNSASGDISINFAGKSAAEIAENILKASKIKSGETIESYTNRFSVAPKTSFEGNLWTITWAEDQLSLYSVRQIQILSKGNDNKIDEDCDVVIIVWIDDADLCAAVSDYIRDHSDGDSAKRPSTYSTLEADGIYQYTLTTPVTVE
jgi:hypothetical protein